AAEVLRPLRHHLAIRVHLILARGLSDAAEALERALINRNNQRAAAGRQKAEVGCTGQVIQIAARGNQTERVSASKPDDGLIRRRGVLGQVDVDRDAIAAVGGGDRHALGVPAVGVGRALDAWIDGPAIVRVQRLVGFVDAVADWFIGSRGAYVRRNRR